MARHSVIATKAFQAPSAGCHPPVQRGPITHDAREAQFRRSLPPHAGHQRKRNAFRGLSRICRAPRLPIIGRAQEIPRVVDEERRRNSKREPERNKEAHSRAAAEARCGGRTGFHG